MAITARAKQTLQGELSRLEKERAAIDKDIASLKKSLSVLGTSTRSSSAGSKRAAGAKRGRPKSNKLSPRAEKALKIIKSNPGIKGADLAKKMGMSKNPTGIYPVIRRLEQVGKIKKNKKSKGFTAV